MAVVARHAADDFAPCATGTLITDELAIGWYTVPTEIKDWIRGKAVACQSGAPVAPLTDLPVVVWGAFDEERGDQDFAWRWTSGRVVISTAAEVSGITLLIRDPTPSQPATVTVVSPEASWAFAAHGLWQVVHVPMPTTAPAFRRRLSTTLTVSPTFVPAALDPSSDDRRALGVQMRVESIRRRQPRPVP
jgi:hypothetical protein